jgi:hypothetical protein
VLAPKKSLGDMEAFAESAIKLERVMKRPHDWENEEDLKGPPPFLLPQVRRLYRMIEHESPERKNYFQRQIDFAVQGNVTEIAAALIVQYQQEGSVDWDQEEYIKLSESVLQPDHSCLSSSLLQGGEIGVLV